MCQRYEPLRNAFRFRASSLLECTMCGDRRRTGEDQNLAGDHNLFIALDLAHPNLIDALRSYQIEVADDPSNMVLCGGACGHTPTVHIQRRGMFTTFPDVLVFMLNRFTDMEHRSARHLHAPLVLSSSDLLPIAPADGTSYELRCVIKHIDSSSPRQGHYTCNVQCGGKWFSVNDASVTALHRYAKATSNGDYLFYVKVVDSSYASSDASAAAPPEPSSSSSSTLLPPSASTPSHAGAACLRAGLSKPPPNNVPVVPRGAQNSARSSSLTSLEPTADRNDLHPKQKKTPPDTPAGRAKAAPKKTLLMKTALRSQSRTVNRNDLQPKQKRTPPDTPAGKVKAALKNTPVMKTRTPNRLRLESRMVRPALMGTNTRYKKMDKKNKNAALAMPRNWFFWKPTKTPR